VICHHEELCPLADELWIGLTTGCELSRDRVRSRRVGGHLICGLGFSADSGTCHRPSGSSRTLWSGSTYSRY
jgi:hypothetical protein